MAGFNRPIWNTKDSVREMSPQIEKADARHKRDLFRNRWVGQRLGKRKPHTYDVLRITLVPGAVDRSRQSHSGRD